MCVVWCVCEKTGNTTTLLVFRLLIVAITSHGHQGCPFGESYVVHFSNFLPLYMNGNLQGTPFTVTQPGMKMINNT